MAVAMIALVMGTTGMGLQVALELPAASETVVAVEFQATAPATAPAELRTTLAVTAAAAASATAPAELRFFTTWAVTAAA